MLKLLWETVHIKDIFLEYNIFFIHSVGCNTHVFSIHPWSLGDHLPAGQTMSTAVGIVWFLEPTFLYVPLYTHLYFVDDNSNYPQKKALLLKCVTVHSFILF